MRKFFTPLAPLALATTVLITGCSECGTPVTVQAAARYAIQFDGVIRYFGTPVPGAKVFARTLENANALAEVKAGPDGHFHIFLPDNAKVGSIVQLVGNGDGHTLTNITTIPTPTLVAQGAGNLVAQGAGNLVAQGAGNLVAQGAGNLVAGRTWQLLQVTSGAGGAGGSGGQAGTGGTGGAGGTTNNASGDQPDVRVTLDAGETMAFMLLGPRLLAASQLNTEASIKAALDIMFEVARTLGAKDGPIIDRGAFDTAAKKALDGLGSLQNQPDARAAIATAIPETIVKTLTDAAEKLAQAIRDAVDSGKPRPDSELLGPIPIGPQTAPPVFQDPTPDTPPAPPLPDAPDGPPPPAPGIADISATPPVDATYVDPAATWTGEAQ